METKVALVTGSNRGIDLEALGRSSRRPSCRVVPGLRAHRVKAARRNAGRIRGGSRGYFTGVTVTLITGPASSTPITSWTTPRSSAP